MLQNIGQYNEDLNNDLEYDLTPDRAKNMTVEEEFNERVRKMQKKEKSNKSKKCKNRENENVIQKLHIVFK